MSGRTVVSITVYNEADLTEARAAMEILVSDRQYGPVEVRPADSALHYPVTLTVILPGADAQNVEQRLAALTSLPRVIEAEH